MFSNWKIRFVIGILLLLLLPGCGGKLPFVETFDTPGDWRTPPIGPVRVGGPIVRFLATGTHIFPQ